MILTWARFYRAAYAKHLNKHTNIVAHTIKVTSQNTMSHIPSVTGILLVFTKHNVFKGRVLKMIKHLVKRKQNPSKKICLAIAHFHRAALAQKELSTNKLCLHGKGYLPAKLPCHMYILGLISCSILLSKTLCLIAPGYRNPGIFKVYVYKQKQHSTEHFSIGWNIIKLYQGSGSSVVSFPAVHLCEPQFESHLRPEFSYGLGFQSLPDCGVSSHWGFSSHILNWEVCSRFISILLLLVLVVLLDNIYK